MFSSNSATKIMALIATLLHTGHGFQNAIPFRRRSASKSLVPPLAMALDVVTYLRTEWISAALCTNQTPRSADVCLQLGVVDGRAVNFLPRTIQELVTSAVDPSGEIPISVQRQLKQQQERRNAGKVVMKDQRADDLSLTGDETVDVVISLQAAALMLENGLDWKKSIREAARVLKPGGRLLFVEQSEIEGESYLEYVEALNSFVEEEAGDDEERVPVFEVGSDDVDLVLTPHIAGVAIKSMEAGMTPRQLAKKRAAEEDERLADLALKAFDRGSRRNRRNKKKARSS